MHQLCGVPEDGVWSGHLCPLQRHGIRSAGRKTGDGGGAYARQEEGQGHCIQCICQAGGSCPETAFAGQEERRACA